MSLTDLFENTLRPPEETLFRRGDPNDVRLGETVLTQPEDYADASVILVGCPQDEGVRRNKGRLGAAAAPDAVRHWLYRLVPPEPSPRLFDLGNTRIQPTLEATHERQREVVRQVLRDGKRVIALGGGNDLSYPDCSAVALEAGPTLAFNVDTHFDVRADQPRNSGTPYRQLLEEGFVDPRDFYELASQPFANSPIYRDYLQTKQAHVVGLKDLRRQGLLETVAAALAGSSARSVFWGLDLDSVRAADAPGVSAPNATGLFAEELCLFAELAGQEPRTRLIELTEINPQFDIDGRTCRLAAVVLHSFLNALTTGA